MEPALGWLLEGALEYKKIETSLSGRPRMESLVAWRLGTFQNPLRFKRGDELIQLEKTFMMLEGLNVGVVVGVALVGHDLDPFVRSSMMRRQTGSGSPAGNLGDGNASGLQAQRCIS